MRLVLCAFIATLLATMTITGCSDDDYKSSVATSEDGGDASALTDGGTDGL